MNNIFSGLILIATIVIPIYVTIMNFLHLCGVPEKKEGRTELLTIIFGIIDTALLFFMLDLKEWNEAITVVDGLGYEKHTFISYEHMPTFLTFAIIAIAGYCLLRVKKTNLPPLVMALCIASIYIGWGLSVFLFVQFLKEFDGATFAFTVFLINYIFITVKLIIDVIRDGYPISSDKEISGKFKWLKKMLFKIENLPFISFLAVIPLAGIIILILLLFGQEPTSIIKTFTETSDWTLSTKIAPPNVYTHSNHYLCTVAATGDEKLVKPLRLGERRGGKIIVNRQLCVANAFEEFLNEKSPRVHHFIRKVYDKYGYPLAGKIKTPLAADIVYILMKPLEWFFVLVLYMFDLKPEDRIAVQYTPLKKQEK